MKSGKRIAIAAAIIGCGAVMLRGALEPWVQHIPTSPAIAARLHRATPVAHRENDAAKANAGMQEVALEVW